jgi:hypothetical protein
VALCEVLRTARRDGVPFDAIWRPATQAVLATTRDRGRALQSVVYSDAKVRDGWRRAYLRVGKRLQINDTMLNDGDGERAHFELVA